MEFVLNPESSGEFYVQNKMTGLFLGVGWSRVEDNEKLRVMGEFGEGGATGKVVDWEQTWVEVKLTGKAIPWKLEQIGLWDK